MTGSMPGPDRLPRAAMLAADQAAGGGIDVVALVVAGFCLVLGFGFLPFWRRTWRGERAETVQGILNAFGHRIGKALHSAITIGSPFFLVAGIGLVVDVARVATSGVLRAQLDTAFNVLLTIFGILVLLLWTIVLFNQPKLLVPPHMRYYHGIIGDLIVTAVRKVFRRG